MSVSSPNCKKKYIFVALLISFSDSVPIIIIIIIILWILLGQKM